MRKVRSLGAAAAAIILCTVLQALGAEPASSTGQTTTIARPAMATAATLTGGATSAEQLTLDQCIDITLKRNPNLTAAESVMNAASTRVGQAKSAYYPQVNLSAGYTRFSLPTEQRRLHRTSMISARPPARCGSSV
jgi:outer membrane protein TolC